LPTPSDSNPRDISGIGAVANNDVAVSGYLPEKERD